MRKRIHAAGMLFSIYLVFNGIERFFIEKIRINPDYSILGIKGSQAEFIAILLILFGLFGIWYTRKKALQPQS